MSTIHSAKGLEWDSVFVIHAADGNIPSDMATGSEDEIEEERRLFYVALTRAKNRLTVCHPQRYYFHGRHRSDEHSYSQLSRFLSEDTRTHFEQKNASTALGADDQTGSDRTVVASAEVRNRMKKLWT